MAIYRTGYKANDAYTVYLEMGAPADLTPAQIAELNDLTRDAPEVDHVADTEADGSLALHVPMRSNDIVLVSVSPIAQNH